MAIWAIGLMTGTVLDGNVDIAMLRTDGERIEEFGPTLLAPYRRDIRPLLKETLAEAAEWGFEGPEPEIFAEAERALTIAQADAIAAMMEDEGISAEDVGVIGFHGQTVLHRARTPERLGATRQLGDGQLMADRLGIPVVYDFRSADVAAGGQGAPLAPLYHRALLRRIGAGEETAFLNLGGVANVTWVAADGSMQAFDTGPANAPLNDWMGRRLGAEMDRDGVAAAKGHVDEARLASILANPYCVRPYPKSLDRNDFSAAMAEGLSTEDGAALLTAVTAGMVGRALDLLPHRPTRLVVAGGGRRNPVLMREIAERAHVEVENADALGLRGDTVEAECFAYLAVRSLRGLPISFPTTTGAPEPMTGGRLALPPGRAQPAPSELTDGF
ncbi:anhydro-N-acetylmuramic acid kinase [Aureimonas ureilytica]|uniref:Anhydro-N-acetylmuramic acid kinase n=1 Tax=Aureimonas ureilytica TaxID=401562 RepID=A0A175RME6_9HYPH|nr:anhydro-N-acetylmuramic acid kinase [Aureimonas ureilytica]KTR04985.1 anhydro-N-acetylmuramic acid kinase [Aureimonas ureilytica]